MFRRLTALAALAAALAVLAAPASADSRWSVRGAGFGHGVGLSQWGAYGQAKAGRSYRQILTTYYSGTTVAPAASRTVRVLLAGNQRRVRLTGARSACGRTLNPRSMYVATRRGSRVVLRSRTGRALRTCASPLSASGSGIRVGSLGRYRGRIEVRVPASGGGLHAINALGTESYVRGVIARESPSSWPAEALKAQAVAARTYALTTSKQGDGFDQYADTRSQVYGGLAAETRATNAAAGATQGEVVTTAGRPVTTYFFSTSGGRTENVEFSFIGAQPRSWLKSVDDPWDSASPVHTWGPIRYASSTLASRLGVGGSLQDVNVVQRGVSPRIVKAEIVGSRSRRTLTGPAIRSRLGLRDTWIYFRRVSTSADGQDDAPDPSDRDTGSADPGSSGGVTASRARTALLSGTVSDPPSSGRVVLQRRQDGRWRRIRRIRVTTDGKYRTRAGRGTWRVVSGWAAGPAVRVR